MDVARRIRLADPRTRATASALTWPGEFLCKFCLRTDAGRLHCLAPGNVHVIRRTLLRLIGRIYDPVLARPRGPGNASPPSFARDRVLTQVSPSPDTVSVEFSNLSLCG